MTERLRQPYFQEFHHFDCWDVPLMDKANIMDGVIPDGAKGNITNLDITH